MQIARFDASNSIADSLLMRRSVHPSQLGEPGPTASEVATILTIASRIPDHGALVPWRFIVAQGSSKVQLTASLTAVAHREIINADEAIKIAGKLAVLLAPPLVVFVVGSPREDRIPLIEQQDSAAAACMALLIAATALGYGANWLTGWCAGNPAARAAIGLTGQERIAGIIPIGTALATPPERQRPALETVVTWL